MGRNLAVKPGVESDDELDSDELDAFIETHHQPEIKTPAIPEKESAAKESAAAQEKESAAKESAGKKKVKISEPKKVQEEGEDDESSDEGEDMDADDDDSDLDLDSDEDESDSEDEESEDEETPKKVQSGKKKPAESKKTDEESEDEETPKKVQSGKKKPADSKKKFAVPAKKDEDESDSEDEESEEEETPKKVQSGKKRATESSKKTPTKKVKLATPQKTDGKKSNDHVATPHPSKKSGKTAGKQTPKSASSHKCQKCDRAFATEAGLGSHTKDKHGAGK
ncbi:hypothetical protein DM860_011192 [Cuscuta australis]|uniref:C2H2-type domain-containing protein n=1 Tax=Cuscuta australis TaxID=267555 RepID=A0A328DPB4_9ASTE|nr:hypothetical protein DM860_011192 [Cuscuta australis]